ncbi:Hsp20/alpha crystallin family protein [Shimazuella sp. AN120528]|uniref:Hsp20/alpha crystallin family protein n=1 Tax=Shimazuella soli TaxID=1892854 RepID=UPI001F109AA8|nr:Hsp20/alpha crystallin family protein [Shimazuella soli]MCH5584638.1 Hsp20/alpha crystallin family protein [Shimazuella soli]
MQEKNFGSFNWDEFIKSFQQSASSPNTTFEMDFSKVEDFISKSMNDMFKANTSMGQFNSTSSKREVFETHDYMIVKLPIPENINPRDVSVFLDTNILMISGLGKDMEKITLPMNGSFTGCQGYVKNGIMEIRVPKNEKKNFREIMIKYL